MVLLHQINMTQLFIFPASRPIYYIIRFTYLSVNFQRTMIPSLQRITLNGQKNQHSVTWFECSLTYLFVIPCFHFFLGILRKCFCQFKALCSFSSKVDTYVNESCFVSFFNNFSFNICYAPRTVWPKINSNGLNIRDSCTASLTPNKTKKTASSQSFPFSSQ